MSSHEIASKETWLEARRALMVREKALMRAQDELAQARRALPWVRVEKEYTLQGPQGPVKLGDLFAGRSQLVVYHFMFGPDWKVGCNSCSFWADHFDAVIPHLAARDVSFAVVSRGPRSALTPFADRMGWRFDWYSSADTDFNFDFDVSFTPEQLEAAEPRYNFGTKPPHGEEAHGISVFTRDADGNVFHTYSTYARGAEVVNATYQFLDLVPKGRDEGALPFTMSWVKLHDEYQA